MMTPAPDAFLSYTRFDDQHDGGAISELRLRLSGAVRAVTGRPFEIFQDIDGIGLGEKWSGKLDRMLDQARFFIPIITPSYFESPACRDELEKFLRAEAARGRSDLVLPIYYIECEVLEDPDLRRADPLATAIHERQRQDWRELRFEPIDAKDVRMAHERLAREIVRARRRAMPQAPARTSGDARSAPSHAPRREHSAETPAGQRAEAPKSAEEETGDRSEGVQEPGTVFRDIDAPWCPELVVVPRGRSTMGSPTHEKGRFNDEGPQHEVRIAYDLAVGCYPITFEEYDRFVEAMQLRPPGDQRWGRGRRPVINVSWHDAKSYVEWLCQQTRERYRLLSEAEWEYACRAGTTTPYWWGDEITPDHANYDGNLGRPIDVGAFPPNAWGLYDMHGNVWEWVEDCWKPGYRDAPDDGRAWISPERSIRMLRGGSWDASPAFLRSAARGKDRADNRDSSCGFRVARTVP